jgi:coproporphyrinogen III oxidase
MALMDKNVTTQSRLTPEQKSRFVRTVHGLQEQITHALETLEDDAGVPLYHGHAGRFELHPWQRGDGSIDLGGGRGALLAGRFFEKAGCHVSEVYGEFPPEFAGQIPGASEDPRFWAAGLSMIFHPVSPRVPSAHMNIRLIETTRYWFGGGSDLNPTIPALRTADHVDTLDFHAALQSALDPFGKSLYPRFKAAAETYYYLPHRGEHRGVGGTFIEGWNSGSFDRDYDMIVRGAEAFLDIYTTLARRRMPESWSPLEEEEMLLQRGRYVEFNLLYDRGTVFGLKTGGNVKTILSSMPPRVKWAG